MTPERWRQVEELCHAALKCRESERTAFLASACAGDEDLRREVESLLEQRSSARGFLEGPAVAVAAQTVSDDSTSVLSGRRLGAYHLHERIGIGGMGEVYRAHDMKLDRDVAIKVLPRLFTTDPDRLARFEREARVLASLNHPHIGAIYGVEDADGIRALVLELVEGPTLADRIARGRIPVEEALRIAIQIAEALEAAHDHGIIHRDLKPANIKVRDDDTVKVLDFGLAKAFDPVSRSAASTPMLTPSIPATEAGIILGTATYMSPEQARPGMVDRRADIWGFGAVLFEMLAGRHAFAGETASETLASVLKNDPPWNALPPDDVPLVVRRLLRRCLEKDPKRRLQAIGDARLEIQEVLTGAAEEYAPIQFSNPVPRWRRALPWGVTAAVVAIAGVLASRGVNRTEPAPVYASLDAPADYVLGEDDNVVSLPTRTPMVFTPDGRSLILQAARAGRPQLFMRSLDHPDARPIAGTDDARVPFISPDGKWIGFWAANELRKVPLEGGAATTICPLQAILGPYGAAWGAEDVIVFGDEVTGRIMRVPARGGVPAPVTAQPPPSERRHVAPSFLPDGRILFSDVSVRDANDSRLMVQSIDGGDARLVVSKATDGRLLSPGHLAFMRLGTLMTVPFDLARTEVTGEAVAAMGDVMQSGLRSRVGAYNTGAGMFAVSSLGALAVVRGALTGPRETHLVWAARDGRSSSAEPISGAPAGGRLFTRISPDGSRAIVSVPTPIRRELWLADWTRDLWTACADCNSGFGPAVWSSDGRHLLFGRNDTLVARAVGGSAPDQVLIRETGHTLYPVRWLADARIIYVSLASSELDSFELRLLEPGGSAGRVLLPFRVASDADVSADSHWLAYTSYTSTSPQENQGVVFVQAFPDPGPRIQVSAVGGSNPSWSPDGKTLYYVMRVPDSLRQALMAVDIVTAGGLTAGKPRQLFGLRDTQSCAIARCYDVSADGRQFLLRDRGSARRESVTRMDLVLNWTSTLARRQSVQ